LKFQEVILVHVVAMQRGEPTAASLARQLNRDDVQNLQYSLRKLVEGKYLLQSKKAGSRVVTYSIDTKGQQFVEDYADMRSKLLASRTGFIEDIDEKLGSASQLLGVLTGIYDSAAMVSSTYSPVFDSVENIGGATEGA
jgi:predicted MarR family transcription regulator